MLTPSTPVLPPISAAVRVGAYYRSGRRTAIKKAVRRSAKASSRSRRCRKARAGNHQAHQFRSRNLPWVRIFSQMKPCWRATGLDAAFAPDGLGCRPRAAPLSPEAVDKAVSLLSPPNEIRLFSAGFCGLLKV
jgi:hypothetical protein